MIDPSDASDAGLTAHAWRPGRFMVIVAHPDDADFGPAATAARWIDEGSVGWLVCCTSGDAGSEDAEMDPLELAALRESEQQSAADVVGYAGLSFLHQPDGGLANELPLRELLVREIRTFRPDAVLANDP
jgi:LmbE family N-acetylglucosaminyl deacetylase